MSQIIKPETTEKLTHESKEIRLHALYQIESKLSRALEQKDVTSSSIINLYTALIKCLRYRPYESRDKILGLLVRVLASEFSIAIVRQLGFISLKKDIEDMISTQKNSIKWEREFEDIFRKLMPMSMDGEIVDTVHKLNLKSEDKNDLFLSDDLEMAWSIISDSDYKSLRLISEVFLSNQKTNDEVLSALNHLQCTLNDYPAEYMLQPPHIFKSLLLLWDRQGLNNRIKTNIVITLKKFLSLLKNRLNNRRKVDAYVRPPTLLLEKKSNTEYFQIKIKRAMEVVLEKLFDQISMDPLNVRLIVVHMMKAVLDVFEIVKLHQCGISNRILHQAFHIKQKWPGEAHQHENHLNIIVIKKLWFTFALQEMVKINSVLSPSLGNQQLLESEMRDFAFQICYPKRFYEIEMLLKSANPQIEFSSNALRRIEKNVITSIGLLKQNKSFKPDEIILNAKNIIITLDILKSLKLVKLLINSILESIPLFLSQNDLKMKASQILLQLLALTYDPLKTFVYQSISMAMKKHFTALMNGEFYSNGFSNEDLLSALIIGVPMNCDIVQIIALEGLESDCSTIKQCSEDIFLLLLKSHHFSRNAWNKILEILLPILPLLQGVISTSNALKEPMNKLMDPDSKIVSLTTLLRGNISFMFSSDTSVRNEALSRLMYIINSLPESTNYIPNITDIKNFLPNDLCILHIPRKFCHIFTQMQTGQELNTLHNILTLLDTPDTDPYIRNTALLQLNFLLKDYKMTAVFCENDAHCLILRVLENCLQKDCTIDCTDSIAPTASILVKLLFYDTNFRTEISNIPNIYVLLIRAIFYYNQSIEMRRDISICLFLMIFGSYLDISFESGIIYAPKLIAKLKCPLSCNIFRNISKKPEVANVALATQRLFDNDVEWNLFLKQLIVHAYSESADYSKHDIEKMRSIMDIPLSLFPQKKDFCIMKSYDCLCHMRTLLKSIANASDEKILTKALNIFQIRLILFSMQGRENIELHATLVEDMFSLLNKYLQITPGNANDLEVYSSVLDLFNFCVYLKLESIPRLFFNTKNFNSYHGVIFLLYDSETPLDFLFLLTEFLVNIFKSCYELTFNTVETNKFEFLSNIFEKLHKRTLEFFQVRDFQRVRFLLRIMSSTSCYMLDSPDKKIVQYCKSFVRLSISIRSHTQTGAQWHRDCLLSYVQLASQVSTFPTFQLSETVLRYVIGMCGHNDVEVRVLSWIFLFQLATPYFSSCTKNLTSINSQLLTNRLSYLPGGFLGSCLSTFLDPNESIIVRHLAGNLFVIQLKSCSFHNITELLTDQDFFNDAHTSLSNYVPATYFDSQRSYIENSVVKVEQFVTCDIVSCFCKISFALIEKRAEFVDDLCKKPLLLKLYALIKLPGETNNPAYYEMISMICQLYAACSKNNFGFLQQTLCHDESWILCFFTSLESLLNSDNNLAVVNAVQLLLVLCQEDFVLELFFTELKTSTLIDLLSQRALTISNVESSLQHSALSLLTFLLIKSQPELSFSQKKGSFLSILESNVLLNSDSEIVKNWKIFKEKKQNKKSQSLVCNKLTELPLSFLLFFNLNKLFLHLYPNNTCNFKVLPSKSKIEVCETLSLLLKQCSQAQKAAKDLGLFDNILHFFSSFFDEFTGPCTTYIRRHGEAKKQPIVKNLQIILQIVLSLFSSSRILCSDELICFNLTKVIIKIWPWLLHSAELKKLILQICSFFSEKSLIACRQLSILMVPYSHSALQLIAKLVISETQKIKFSKTISSNSLILSGVKLGLRTMMNCCASTEGRLLLIKESVFNVIENLINTKGVSLELFHLWLKFWEFFSRYNEGGQVRELDALCSLINKSCPNSITRTTCIKILRNMSFVDNSRFLLISSSNFIYTIHEILAQPFSTDQNCISYEEQFIVCVAIWQIVAGGVKFMAAIKGTTLYGKLNILQEKLLSISENSFVNIKEVKFAEKLAVVVNKILIILRE